MHRAAALLACVAAAFCAAAADPAPAAQADRSGQTGAAIPVAAFNDGVNHWRSGRDGGYARHDPADFRAIADNLLLQQRRSGGWPVNQDPLRVLDAEARQAAVDVQQAEDRRLLADPSATPLWGRFHDLADNPVVLADRDGNRLQDYAQVSRERRTGYHWYGTWPQALLQRDAPAWRRRLAAAGTPAPAGDSPALPANSGYHPPVAAACPGPRPSGPVAGAGIGRPAFLPRVPPSAHG